MAAGTADTMILFLFLEEIGFDAEALQSRFGEKFLIWSGEVSEDCRRISQRVSMANFCREFFGLVSPGLQAPPPRQKKKFTPKMHAQNCQIPFQFTF